MDNKRKKLDIPWIQMIKFVMVGISNSLIHLGIYNLLLLLRMHYIACNAVAFFVSVIWAFFINRIWVFKDRTSKKTQSFMKTVIVYLFSFSCSSLLLLVYVDLWNINEKLAPIINIIIFTPINFVLMKFWAQRVSNQPTVEVDDAVGHKE